MRAHVLAGTVALAALTGCGLESLFNTPHPAYDRPASRLVGATAWAAAPTTSFVGLDGNGNELAPFLADAGGGRYEARFPSARYTMMRVQGRAGGLAVRAIVPAIGEEQTEQVDLDARAMTETLIVEAWLSANGKRFAQLTPAAYTGNGVDTGTRTLIRQDLDRAGPTQELLRMVERLVPRADVGSGAVDPDLFGVPAYDASWNRVTSAIAPGFLARNPFDYDGDGTAEIDSADFDAKLAEAAQLYSPEGCPDPDNIRAVFSVDFNQGSLNGVCGAINRFKWATDKPGKQMYFVAWVHDDSAIPADPVERARVNSLVGAGVPNQLPMYDDGTNGDEVADDGIWTIFFDLPKGVRLGYKYTWGLRGQGWTGSEEWPGNSRIIEIVDVNGDGFVNKRDVFADEHTNKDVANLNPASGGTLSWDEDLRGCGPEAREQKVTLHSACGCDEWLTPQAIGPLTLACPAGP